MQAVHRRAHFNGGGDISALAMFISIDSLGATLAGFILVTPYHTRMRYIFAKRERAAAMWL